MRRTPFLPVLVAAILMLVGLPAGASAQGTTGKILNDCTDGTLDSSYTTKQLQTALNKLASDAGSDDYTSCGDVINAALTSGSAQRGGGSGSGGSGGGPAGVGAVGAGGGAAVPGSSGTPSDPTSPGAARTASPQENADATKAATDAATPKAGKVDLSGVRVPTSALNLGSSGADLPLPLLVALIACGGGAVLAGAAAGVQVLRRRRAR